MNLVKINLSGNPLAATAPGTNKIWYSVWYEDEVQNTQGPPGSINDNPPIVKDADLSKPVGASEDGRDRPQGWKETDHILKKQTRVVLDVLRSALPLDTAQAVRDKLAAIQMQIAMKELRKALCVADKVALDKALRAASLAGIPTTDLSVHLATRALGIAIQLSDAADARDKQQLESSLGNWKEHRVDLADHQPKWLTAQWLTFSNGPDHERAKYALRQLTLNEIAIGFRNMHHKDYNGDLSRIKSNRYSTIGCIVQSSH